MEEDNNSGKQFEYYDDNDFEKFNERRQRLKEIEERERFLRREKYRIQRDKPWFKKPQNLIAVFGILLPIIFSVYISQTNQDKKELTIEYSEIEPLIVESSNFGNNVSIKYDSTDINNISRVKFKITNTGTLDIEKSDFVDGAIKVALKPNSNRQDLKLFKISNKENAGQQNAILKFESLNKESSFTYLPSLLNQGDQVIMDLYLIDPIDFKFEVKGKIRDGNIIGPFKSKNEEIRIGYKTFVLSINSLFGFKWLTIPVLIILFIILGFASMFIFTMNEDTDAPAIVLIMGTVVGLIALLNLIIVISLIIYV